MSYPINYPTPQGANIQIFKGADPQTTGHLFERTWVKPQGASFVWFTLIGAGGAGGRGLSGTANGYGGGSGAVTNFMGPAFLMPDALSVIIGVGGAPGTSNGASGGSGTASTIVYQQKDGTGYTLLTANGGSGGNGGGGSLNGVGGTASTSNYFSAIGFFQSIAGQDGSNSPPPSSTTFLSGGSRGDSFVRANYGYKTSEANSNGQSGMFQMQPIIVGLGSTSSASAAATTYAGIGCGGGGGNQTTNFYGGKGGDGMVVIITW